MDNNESNSPQPVGYARRMDFFNAPALPRSIPKQI
jgi:hypothetical protein